MLLGCANLADRAPIFTHLFLEHEKFWINIFRGKEAFGKEARKVGAADTGSDLLKGNGKRLVH